MIRLLAALALPVCVNAQSITIEQSLSLKTAVNAQISPDGRFVAYTVQETDWDQDEFVTQIWIRSTDGAEANPLTFGKRSSGSPRWSPDSKRIAFASARDGKRQIYVISNSGGEAYQLTHEEREIGPFEWAPDSRSIAFVAAGPESSESKARRGKFGPFEVVEEDSVKPQLWLLPAPVTPPHEASVQPKPELLTPNSNIAIETFSWSPNGSSIAFEGQQLPGYTSDETARVYVLDIASRSTRKLLDDGVPNHRPVWSPDGSQIAFTMTERGKPTFPSNVEIAIAPAKGGPARILTADFDESARVIDWGPDGIYFGVFQLESAIYRLETSSGKRDRINPPGSVGLSGASFSHDHRRVAGIAVRPNLLAEVCVSAVDHFAPSFMTELNGQRKGFRFATREAIRWKSKDGTEVEGILIKPVDYDSSRKYPLLVVIHGGPATLDNPSYTPDRDYPIEAFAAKGAVILRPNYRGSTGYGEKFRSLILGNIGIGPYEDMISGVDSLIAKGIADPDRMGVMGWSQGGYNTAFAATYGDRFKAASAGAGITDWVTYYVNTDLQWFTRQMLGATPWENPGIYRLHSPISYAARAKTPILFQHGSRDPRVPVPDSFELYRALKDKGVPTRLILYSGFGHIIDKPKSQRAVMQHNYEWFSKYIWGEEGN